MRHSKGYRNRGRKLFRKKLRERGKIGLSRLLYNYKIGDRVAIDINPNDISHAPHRRYQGKVGVILEKRGRSYVIGIKIGRKEKKIITTPFHFKPLSLSVSK